MRSVAVLLVFAACADPVVEMQLVLPKNADNFDTSCINAVEVRVTGANFLNDPDDYERSCIPIEGGTSYAAIREAIRGKFEVLIPDSGISGIEIYGWSGPTACEIAAEDDPFESPNLLFAGRGDYIGQDRVDIPVVPNLSCARSQLTVKQTDMFALIGGKTCAQAGAADVIGASGIGIGTLMTRLYGKGARYYGNLDGGEVIGGAAVSFTGPTVTGPRACLAMDIGDFNLGGSTSCVVGGASVCAGPGEVEVASIPYALLGTDNLDTSLMTKFPVHVLATVWSNATPRTLLSGATVQIDPNHAKVIYLDPPNTAGIMVARADQSSTGPSGLFALYADSVVAVKVTAGAATRTVTLGSPNEFSGAAMIVMGP
jgi:hypothetical protein